MATQRERKIREGRKSRWIRDLMNVQVDSPRRRKASYATRFANPPTKKKIGITWRTHVASQSPEVAPIALVR